MRQLHSTPVTQHTHDTVFFTMLEHAVAGDAAMTGGVALVPLDSVLFSKSSGFSSCQILNSGGGCSGGSSSKCEFQIGARLRQLLQEPSCQASLFPTFQPLHSLVLQGFSLTFSTVAAAGHCCSRAVAVKQHADSLALQSCGCWRARQPSDGGVFQARS